VGAALQDDPHRTADEHRGRIRKGSLSFMIEGIYRPRAMEGYFPPEGSTVQLSIDSQAFCWVVQVVG
jgi:hypothetical protein